MSQPKIIAALAHACHREGFSGLKWACCPGLYTRDYLDDDSVWPCVLSRGHAGVCCDVEGFPWRDPDQTKPLPPTLAEWQAEWAASHPGEPGPVGYWSDARVSWSVGSDSSVTIRVGTVTVEWWRDRWEIQAHGVTTVVTTAPDLALLARLMAAVDGAR